MRVRVLSDLHLEFHRDGGKSFVDSLDTEGIDLLILAGDLSNAVGLSAALRLIAKHFSCEIAYVHGNHEFHGSDRAGVVASTYAATQEFKHLHWLDNSIVEIGDHRILGTPMWFREAPPTLTRLLDDFSQISGFNRWVYEENSKALSFLNWEMQGCDIIVTHYLPTKKSVSKWYRDDPTNAFFLCDVENLILARQPALWVHGHTHDSADYTVESTRVVCNPLGFTGRTTNREFNPNFTVVL